MLIDTDIIITRVHFPFKFAFGNRIDANKRPDKNPKIFAKLSIIGKNPIANNTDIKPIILRSTAHGFS